MRRIFELKPNDVIFAECIKCKRAVKGPDSWGWLVIREDDSIVGCICPDCQTDEESLEAQANTTISDSIKESDTISFLEPCNFQKKHYQHHIKVNFPTNIESHTAGINEAIWCVVNSETKAAHDTDATGKEYTGFLLDDSWYWKGLEIGSSVPIHMNGQERPECPLEWLNSHYVQFEEDE